MFRKHRKMIVWLLVVVMTHSPSMAFAQQPDASKPAATADKSDKAKIDLGYVTPETMAAAVAFPRRVLTAPEMEMLPLEVFSAAGKKELGIDPLEIEQVMWIVEPPLSGPPQMAIVLRMTGLVDQTRLFPQLQPLTEESQLNGKSYRKAKRLGELSIFCPDDRTVILATEDILSRALSNYQEPKEGEMSKVLAKVDEPPDAMAVVLIKPIRPMIAMPLAMAPVPPPFEDIKKIPDLLDSVGVKVNLAADPFFSLTLRTNDDAAALELEQVVDNLLSAVKDQVLSRIAEQSAETTDPIAKAAGQYARRMVERTLPLLRPVRKGQDLTLAADKGISAQMGIVAYGGLVMSLLLPAVQSAREAARHAVSQNNMKQIDLAILNYEQVNGEFPPAYKADKDGKPLLSWRVLILPYIEQDELYKQFHLDEPWDSDHNKQLIDKMPPIYQCPKSALAGQCKSNYLTVRGEKTMFPGKEGVTVASVTDGTSNTITAVEVPDDRAVVWTKPDDFQYDPENPQKGLFGMWPAGAIVGLTDGSVRTLSPSIDAETLIALFTRNGGEPVDWRDIPIE